MVYSWSNLPNKWFIIILKCKISRLVNTQPIFYIDIWHMKHYSHLKQYTLTLYTLNFSEGTKHIFTFYDIPPHKCDTFSWNSSLSKTRTYLFYIVNIMDADVLATQGARASATMILTLLNRSNLVPTYWGLNVILNGGSIRACHHALPEG